MNAWEKCPHCFGVGGHADTIPCPASLPLLRIQCVWCSGSGSIHPDLVLQYFYVHAITLLAHSKLHQQLHIHMN